MGGDKKKRKREEKEEKKKHKKRHKHEKHGKEKKKSKKHKKEKKHKAEDSTANPAELRLQKGGACSVSSKALSSLMSHHPNGAKQLFLIAKALQDGQGVALDLLPSPALRKRVAAVLESCTYTPPSTHRRKKKPSPSPVPLLCHDLQGLSLSTTYRLRPYHDSPLDHPLLTAMLHAVDKVLGPLPDVSCVQAAVDRLLSSFPVLERELPPLLARVAQGERVDVSGLEDEKLKRGLVGVFEALGFTYAAEGEGEEAGYGLVKGEGRRAQRAQVKEVLWRNGGQALLDDIPNDDDDDEQDTEEQQDNKDKDAQAAEGAEAEGGPVAMPVAVRKGPAMPDAATLALAQEQAARMMQEGLGSEEEGEESEDDLVGPSLGDNRTAVPDHIAFKHLAPKEEGGREEWMTMGPGKAMGSLAALMPTMSGRQFQQRSTRAKNAAPSVDKKVLTPAQIAELKQEAAKESKRKTLLEQHQERAAKGQGPPKEEPLARKAWNREEFMEGRKTLDAREAQKLFVAAKELGTRFSRTFR